MGEHKSVIQVIDSLLYPNSYNNINEITSLLIDLRDVIRIEYTIFLINKQVF